MKKKILSVIIAATMVFGLTACGTKEEPVTVPDTKEQVSVDVETETDKLVEETESIEEEDFTSDDEEEIATTTEWYKVTGTSVITTDYGYGVELTGENGTITTCYFDYDYIEAIINLNSAISNMEVRCDDMYDSGDTDIFVMNDVFTIKDDTGEEHEFITADKVNDFYTELTGNEYIHTVYIDEEIKTKPKYDITGLSDASLMKSINLMDLMEEDGSLTRTYKYISKQSDDVCLVFNNDIGTCAKVDYEVYDANGGLTVQDTQYIALKSLFGPSDPYLGFAAITLPKDGVVTVTFSQVGKDEFINEIPDEQIFRLSSLSRSGGTPDDGKYELDGSYKIMYIDVSCGEEIYDNDLGFGIPAMTFDAGDIINLRPATRNIEMYSRY